MGVHLHVLLVPELSVAYSRPALQQQQQQGVRLHHN
jgi:hypothetical protein